MTAMRPRFFLSGSGTRRDPARSLQTLPSVGSEDFGRFGGWSGAKSAMVFLGAGPDGPRVHTPEYDFRDELIPMGTRIFSETLAACLENN